MERRCKTCVYYTHRICKRLNRVTNPMFTCQKYLEDVPLEKIDISDVNTDQEPESYDFYKAVRLIEQHAPALVSYSYLVRNTGYNGTRYMMKKQLEKYPNLEYSNFGNRCTWRAKV